MFFSIRKSTLLWFNCNHQSEITNNLSKEASNLYIDDVSVYDEKFSPLDVKTCRIGPMVRYNFAYLDRMSIKTTDLIPFYHGPDESTVSIETIFEKGTYGVYSADGGRVVKEDLLQKIEGDPLQLASMYFKRAREIAIAGRAQMNLPSKTSLDTLATTNAI